jgi:DNA-directed RNA polymerase III subunit RPC11
MWFCPLDGTLLQVRHDGMSDSSESNGFFFCSTCPYSNPICAMVTKKTFPSRKVVDDILGGAAAWENVDRTMAPCPACNHTEAYFMQIQIRSADEREYHGCFYFSNVLLYLNVNVWLNRIESSSRNFPIPFLFFSARNFIIHSHVNFL